MNARHAGKRSPDIAALAPQRDSNPLPASEQSRIGWLREVLRTGGPGQVVFAINNACNANCGFCNFGLERLPRADWKFVAIEDTRRAIDVLHQLFIRYLIVTGGEPLLHPGLDEIVRYASGRGMNVMLVTNGSRLTESRCQALADAGVSSLIISIDAETVQRHESNRRLPGVCARIRHANSVLRRLHIPSIASVTVSRLLEDEDALVALLRQLGFENVTFSYPLNALPSSFLGWADSALVDFTEAELHQRFERIKQLKRRFDVINPTASLNDMQRLVRKQPQHFACLGGYRYFYLDWDLMIWRCHHWHEPLCSVFDFDESKYVRDGCTACMVDCFRDASVMQHIAVSVADAARDVRAGRFFRAFDHLFRASNLESLRAVLENRRFIRSL